MILVIVAAQLGSLVPLTPLFTYLDVPVGLVKENVRQTVRVALTVKPDGKAQSCQVEEGSGSTKLDSYTCKLMARRARFKPLTQVEGRPLYRVYRTHIDWWVGAKYPPSSPIVANIYLTVSALPLTSKSPTLVRLNLAVDEMGRASDCAAEATRYDPTLVRIGCGELLKMYKPTPARTVEGVPVTSVQTATVAFQKN